VDCPDLAEIEINPLMAGPAGEIAVDARATLAAQTFPTGEPERAAP